MTPSERVAIGVDVTGGKRPMTIAVLDQQLQVVTLKNLPLDDLIAEVLRYELADCAIDAPSRPNPGLLTDGERRRQWALAPASTRYSTYRICEYELRRRGIGIYNTPLDPAKIKGWMQRGWDLYRALHQGGFVPYPSEGSMWTVEVFPHACFTTLLGAKPLHKATKGGLEQRQTLLRALGMTIAAVDSLEAVLTHDELDALVAAYTAYLLRARPEDACAVGSPDDGQIVLPVPTLADRY
ncbi:MAG: DUF429 domain-containing protein [Chloroflexi bacterium]|nr:DUF429 domain-containing protein [Chloroflexota bacterium]